MAYQSVHTGPEVDAAVSVLSDVQDIRDEVETNLNTVTTLAGQTATNAGLAQTAATNAQADAASALTSRNEAHTSAQAAASSAAASDAARAQSVVAKNGAEQARDSAWDAEDETRALLSESGPTIDAINAELRRMKYGSGPYPSLELGFVGASILDRRVEFTRVSNATYWDPLGTLQTAGPNEPRFDYDPVTGESLGLLVEGQATNLLRWSEDFNNTLWVNDPSMVVVVPNDHVAPNGLMEADRVSPTQTGVVRPSQSMSMNPGTYTFSVFLKKPDDIIGNQFVRLRFAQSGVPEEFNASGFFNITTASKGSANPGVTVNDVKVVGRGWVRVSATVTLGYSGPFSVSCIPVTADNSNLSGGSLYVWGAQLETGATPTSYIKTEASQVTRATDVASLELGDWYNQEEGTFIVEFRDYGNKNSPGYDRQVFGVRDTLTSSTISMMSVHTTPSGVRRVQLINNGIGEAGITLGQQITGNEKIAFRFSRHPFFVNASRNGGPVLIDNEGVFSAQFDTLYLGGVASGSSLYSLNGTINRIAYYPRALSDAQLVELTTQ